MNKNLRKLSLQKPRYQRAGAATIEFALVVPIVLLIFFAILEFGRFQVLRMAADEVAYESCRAGIAVGATVSDIEEVSQTLLKANGTLSAEVTISPTVIDDDTQEVSVELKIPLGKNLWIGQLFLKNDIVAKTTLDHENSIYLERAKSK